MNKGITGRLQTENVIVSFEFNPERLSKDGSRPHPTGMLIPQGDMAKDTRHCIKHTLYPYHTHRKETELKITR